MSDLQEKAEKTIRELVRTGTFKDATYVKEDAKGIHYQVTKPDGSIEHKIIESLRG